MYLLFPVPPSGELLSSSAHKGLATPPAAALKGLTDPGPQLTSGLTFLFKKTTQDFPRFFFGTRSGFELVGRGRRVEREAGRRKMRDGAKGVLGRRREQEAGRGVLTDVHTSLPLSYGAPLDVI